MRASPVANQALAPAPTGPKAAAEPTATAPPRAVATPKARKLSFKEQRELESLPQLIEQLEAEQAELHARLADPAFYQQPGSEITAVTSRMEKLDAELLQAYSRWEALEDA